jgi:hypothetical protein
MSSNSSPERGLVEFSVNGRENIKGRLSRYCPKLEMPRAEYKWPSYAYLQRKMVRVCGGGEEAIITA